VRIVLLHGFSDSGRCWSPWQTFFDRFGEVSAPDARGHGGAALPEGPFGAVQHVADLTPRLDEPSVLVGHSMGAVTAAVAAARHPELVRAVVLEDPPWRSEAAEWDPSPYRDWITRMLATPLHQRAAECRAENPHWAEDEIGPWAESKGQVDPAIFERRIEWLSEPWRDTASAIRVPALLLVGDPALGAIIGPTEAAWVRENAAIETRAVEGAGHSIRRDRPDAYRAAVNEFLSGLDRPC
jgi:pimeloyl-ACP methyl ester carboxylesterase